jgi:hypothetical protein
MLRLGDCEEAEGLGNRVPKPPNKDVKPEIILLKGLDGLRDKELARDEFVCVSSIIKCSYLRKKYTINFLKRKRKK